jgi:DNA-binding response OmpR family regulator
MLEGELAGASPASQTTPPQHILVVEDEILVRQTNAAMLLRAGYKVDTATDGADAWRALNTESYDLLITDNNMPNMSGIELLKKLRAARMTLPIIMATGTVPEQDFIEHPWLRPAAILLKPFTMVEMLKIVKMILHEADRTAEASQPNGASIPA